MLEPAVRFYIQYFKTESGDIDATEKEFLSIPFYMDPGITNPKVKNEMGKAGSFEFGSEPGSALYNAIVQLKTFMRIVLFGRTIFRGRVLTIDQSPLTGSHVVHCEGDFSFFLDSFQYGVKDDLRPTIGVLDYLKQIIDQHNLVVEPERRFALGEVPGQYTDATPEAQRVVIPAEKANQQFGDASWNTSMDRLESLLSDFGGFFRTRYDDQTKTVFLDWYDKYYNATTNAQTVEVAKNLIDLSGPAEVSNLFTVVIPIGRSQSEDVFISDYWPLIQADHPKVPWIHVYELVTANLYTEAELNSDYHRAFDYWNSHIQFGQIWKIIDFPNANTPEKLFTYAKDWIKNNYMPSNTQWDVSALDLRFVNGQDQPLYCGDRISLVAPEVDQTYSGMSILSAEYDLFNPDKNKYTIGIPNPETNASYGVPEKTARTTGRSSVAKKGSSGRKSSPKGGEDPEVYERDYDSLKSNYLTNYSLKTDLGQNIGYDDPLAFCRFDEYGNELDEDRAKQKAMAAARLMNRTKAERREELEAEAARRGCAWDDPQLVIEFTPSLKTTQDNHRKNSVYHMVHDMGIDEGVANTIVYETAGQSLLASLVDDNGNWTQKAYDLNIPNEMGADEVKKRAIRTRKELNGQSTSPVSKAVNSVMNWLGIDGINVSNYFNVEDASDAGNKVYKLLFGDNEKDGGKGSVLNIDDITEKASGITNKVSTWFNGLFTSSVKGEDKGDGTGWNWLRKIFTFNSDSTYIDGENGEMGMRTVDENGKTVGEATLGGWQITLNKPYRYTAEIEVDGKMEVHEFVVPDHTIAVDDIHFTKRYDSLRAILAVVDVLLADYAQINSLSALQAQIGNVYIDLETLSYSYSNLEGQYNYLLDTASAHTRTLSDLQGQYNTLRDTVSTHERTLSNLAGQYNTLVDTVSTHSRTLSNLEGQYNTLVDTVSTHSRTLSNLEGQYNTLVDTVSTHSRTLSDISGQYNTLVDTVSTHSRTLSNLEGQYNTLVDTVSTHSRTLSDISGQYNTLVDTVSTHSRTLSNLEGQYNTLVDTVSTHSRTLSDISGQYNTLVDTVSTHSRTLSDISGQYNTLVDTVSTHSRTLSNLEGQYNTLVDTVSTHSRTLSDISGQYNTLVDTVSTHERTISNLDGQYHTLVDTVSEHTRTISSLSGLESRVSQTENTIAAVVEGTGENAKVKPAQIVASITDDNGYLSSEIKLSADRILMDGTTTINDIFKVSSGFVSVTKPIYVSGDSSTTIINPTNIRTDAVYVGTNRIMMKVVDVQPSTTDSTELIITYYDGTTKTFKKAAASSKVVGTWSGGTYTVTANANGQNLPLSVSLSDQLIASGNPVQTDVYGNPSDTGRYVKQDYYVQYIVPNSSEEDDVVSTGQIVHANVNANVVYVAGFTTGYDTVASPTFEKWALETDGSDRTYNAVWFKTDLKSDGQTTRRGVRGVYLTKDNDWSGDTIKVYLRDNTQTGTIVGQITITAPSGSGSTSKISGSWSSGTLTVSSSSSGQSLPVTVTIDSVTANGTPSVTSAGLISVPVQVTSKFGSNSTANTGYSGNLSISPSSLLDTTYATNGATANGTYTPASGKIGFSSFTVNVPSGSTGITGLVVDTTNHAIKTSTSATTQSVTISCSDPVVSYVDSQKHYAYVFSAKAGTSTIASISGTIDATDAYTAGQNAIIDAGGPLNLTANTSSTQTLNRYVTTYTVKVSGSSVNGPTYSTWTSTPTSSAPSSDIISNAIKFVTTDASTGAVVNTDQRTVGLSVSAYDSTNKAYYVYMRDGSTTGNYVGRRTVSATDAYNAGQDNIKNAGGPLNLTANTSSTQTLNRYVTTYTVNVPSSSVTVTGSWSGGTYTVKNSSSGSTLTSTSLSSQLTKSGSPTRCTVDGTASSTGMYLKQACIVNYDNSGTATSTGKTAYVNVDASSMYTAGQDYLKDLGGPLDITENGNGTLNRYVTTYTVNVPNGTGTVAAKPVFSIPSGTLGTSVTITATSSASGATTQSSTTTVNVQTSVSGSTTYAEIYSTTEGRVIARRDITSLVGSGTAANANVEFSEWTSTTGSNAGGANTIKFSNANNANKYATRTIYLTQSDGYVYARDNSSTGTIVAKIQADSSTSNVKLSTSWNSAGTTATVSKGQSGTDNVTFAVGAVAGITYDANTHTYTAAARSVISVNGATGVVRGEIANMTSGTEAYEAGSTDGFTAGQNDVWAACCNNSSTPTAASTASSFSTRIPVNASRVGNFIQYNYSLGLSSTAVNLYYVLGEDNVRTVASCDISGALDAAYEEGKSDAGGTRYRMYKGYNTNDSIYYGKLYDSSGNALTTSSYYWFGCTSNLGGSSASSIYVSY